MAEGRDDGGPEGSDDDLVTLRPGLNIGRYRIVTVLGQGGFGITYRAVDSELGRSVAIKEYLPTALAVRKDGITVVPRSRTAAEDLAWGLDRFVEEGRTLAALHRAPGIVKVHDYLRANGTAYLVMELVEGETLHDRIARTGPLDAAAIDRILAPLLDGLEEVHAAGFLHRDIKPANILIDREGRPTLIDFGASRAAIAGRSQALTAVFTPGYAPVEQFTSGTQGPWTDIYGLAASLHHAITGSPPTNAIDRLLQDTYEPLALSGRAYPGALLAGIDAGLAVRTADRPQSVAAWRAMLRGDAAAAPAAPAAATMKMPGSTSSALPASKSQSPARDVSTRKPVGRAKFAAAAALVLVLAGAGGFGLVSRTSEPPPASAPPTGALPPSSLAAAPSPPPPAQDRAQQELEQARREQRMAVEEAARLRAEAETRRKADEEAALRARIEQEVREKAAAEEAARRQAAEEAKRQAEAQAAADAAAKAKAEAEAKARAEAQAAADAAAKAKAEAEAKARADAQAAADAAAKAKTEAEAKARADAEVAARVQAEEADRKGAEAGEAALRLSAADRQRIQVALTALGHATGSTDGVFGPRSREMIAAWQKQSGRAATGFLTQDQHAALLRDAAPALARHDEEQKKQAAQTQSAGQVGARQCEGTFRSQWCRAAYQGFPPNCWNANMTIRNGEVSDSWVSQADRAQRNLVSGRIDANGNVSLTFDGIGQQTHINQRFTAIMSGRVVNGVLTAAGRAGAGGREFSVTVTCK